MSTETPYNALSQFEDAISDSESTDLPPPFATLSSQTDSHPVSISHDMDVQSAFNRPRTVSRDGSGPMKCPTPDLQSIQGAYKNNVQRLERSAERLSLSSDIGEAIRQLREEQKASDSRRSSILNPAGEESSERSALHRQLSYGYGSHASNSIVGTNSVARSGGFSPAGYYASPRGSFKSSRRSSVLGRSLSDSRLEEVAEPQQEGKPLDSPMSTRFTPLHTSLQNQHEGSPISSPTSSRLAPLLAHQEGGELPHSPIRGGYAPSHAALREELEPSDPPAYDSESRGRGLSNGGLRIVNDETYNLNDVLIPTTDLPIDHDEEEPRPSTDTARQVNGLWSDFDGVHTRNETAEAADENVEAQDEAAALRQLTARENDEKRRTIISPMPSPGPPPGMVYYPAPVPMMLNLPKRLSKMPPNALRDQRRSQLLGNLQPGNRKSAPWLEGTPEMADEQKDSTEEHRSSTEHKRRSTAALPPQLRATMFFDYPAVNHDVEVKGGSAVQTLDSILDASAFAPVSAFTDHPIVGQAGADIYKASARAAKSNANFPGEVRGRSGSGNLLMKRNSRATLLDDGKSRHSLLSVGNYFGKRKSRDLAELGYDDPPQGRDRADGASIRALSLEHDEAGKYDRDDDVDGRERLLDDDEEDLPFGDQPTTLLAELQMRKKQQKSRTKTAATAYPDGMQSTLLELDAVAQVEARARKQKRTLLAWEDPNVQQPGSTPDNEDVPLGMLYPTQKMRREWEERPRGLIAQRQIEDNEPLSHRRARLRGEDPRHLDSMLSQQFPVPTQSQAQDDESDEDHPGETLGQRLKRLKATQIPTNPSRVSGDFTSEIMSQFGGPPVKPTPSPDIQSKPNKADDVAEPEGETLGQRRRRLQAEAAAQAQSTSPDQANLPSVNKRRSMADLLAVHPTGPTGVRAASGMEYVPAPRTRNTSWAMQLNEQAGMARRGVSAGMGAPHPILAGGGDRGRKDMIDRWRMSVMN